MGVLGRAAAALCAVFACASAWAAECPSPPRWPGETWEDRTAQTKEAKADAIRALEEYAFTLTGEDADRQGIRTDGVVIIHQGALVYEKYARGWDASKRHLTWSVSKSFTNALVGMAVKRGLLSLDDSICQHLSGVEGPSCDIQVQHLLEFSSGLDWQEVYEGQSNQASSVLAMLYGEGQRDSARFIASHRRRDPPGESWMYSSGDSTLLMAVLQAAVQEREGERFPWTWLFDPLGIKSAVWERDRQGTIIGSSYLYATPRDMARFGYLFLNDGCWQGERLLPETWVSDSTSVSQAMQKKTYFRDPPDVQGWQWWLNKVIPNVTTERPFKDIPEDAFFARGHWGQSITVIPSLNLVIVRVADDRQRAFDLNTFVSKAIAVVQP